MKSKENDRLIFSSFNKDKNLFIKTLNTMIFDPSTPGDASQKLSAAQDIFLLITEINNVSENKLFNKKEILSNWFESASDEGRALLINAARYVHEKKYINTSNDLKEIKKTMKSIEKIKKDKYCDYGYGYGLDHDDINFDNIFG